MLVSHRYRFIYTKTAKTAGTSVESFFERFCMPDGEWEKAHGRDAYQSPTGIIGMRRKQIPAGTLWWNHMPAAAIKQQLSAEIWNSYFKFCVVRNPYDKCISAFEHFGRRDQPQALKLGLRDKVRAIRMSPEQTRFLDYVRHYPPIDRDKYVIDGTFCLDDVIRFESLGDDIERICQRLGLPFDPSYLPSFKKGRRKEGAAFDRHYTPLSQQVVSRKFAFEIEQFGYQFPASQASFAT